MSKSSYRKPLFRKIFVSTVVLVVGMLAGFSFYSASVFRETYTQQVEQGLRARASLAAEDLLPLLASGSAALQARCQALGRSATTRFTLIRPDGVVLCDSEGEPAKMENHRRRPEVAQALRGEPSVAHRHSDSVHQDFLYVAIPIGAPGRIDAVMRAAISLGAFESALSGYYGKTALAALLLLVLAAGVAWRVSRGISQPLERMREHAERVAEGDFESRARLGRGDALELERLARAMNRIAIQLDQRIRTVTEQNAALEAVFLSMIEGVIAVNVEGEIIHLNEAACSLFGVSREAALGRPVRETIRLADLHALIELASDPGDGRVIERELVVRTGVGGERLVQAHGTALRGAQGSRIGALLVFNDLTRLRELESHRREFVSNVSHELRTPLTSIQGFVETLLDGGKREPGEVARFLEIIRRQAGRLHAIVEDLLNLSRIEADAERDEIPLAAGLVRPILVAAVEVCAPRAQEKGISLELECAEGLKALMNAPLLEQAVINLVDNAVKYTESQRPVRITAREARGAEGPRVMVAVRDEGAGIPREHLPRIFERFYRVDKARSRKVGGTGLGLSIVKHIALAHQGAARVESEVGQGSTFILELQPSS
ncbi:MAG: PAS domain S-box protein [Bdellovibrionales bacterium]|nr:PAS domain S-box protein [Bdellovibrionales bacterium]